MISRDWEKIRMRCGYGAMFGIIVAVIIVAVQVALDASATLPNRLIGLGLFAIFILWGWREWKRYQHDESA